MQELIQIDDAPVIPGLRFRCFQGTSDFPKMAAVIAASSDVDRTDRATSAEDIAIFYANLVNSDPTQDMIFAEIHGEVIGYSRCWWYSEIDNGPYIYRFTGSVVPNWRRKGIGRTMLQWIENRLRSMAVNHPTDRAKFFQATVTQYEVSFAAMLEKEDYRPVRYFYEMLRPTLDNIPNFPLPEGLEIRPVLPEHYRAIWDTANEAFQDNWGSSQPTEEDYQGWLNDKTLFQPHLWQIAWDTTTDQIVGQVRTFIDSTQNEKYRRKRGFTEFISVRRPWRRRGLARALIARSLHAQKEQGMTESALGVDSENLSGATRVYEDCGFHVIKQGTIYRKSLSSLR